MQELEFHKDPCIRCGGRMTTKTAGWNTLRQRPHWCFKCGTSIQNTFRKISARVARKFPVPEKKTFD